MTENTISVNPAELSVDIGFPCGPNIPWQTAMSLMKTSKACAERRIPLGVACIAGSSVVTWARSKVLDTFLQGDAKYLFWIDSDIVWEPGDFLKMLALCTRYSVVCAVYAQKNEAQTIVIRHADLSTFDVNPHGLLKVDGAGLGFTVISREVAERIVESAQQVYDPAAERSIADVFRIDTVERGHENPDCRHEDVAFFADVQGLGYDVWLDPTIQLGHVGSRVYHADPMAALRADEVFNIAAMTQ